MINRRNFIALAAALPVTAVPTAGWARRLREANSHSDMLWLIGLARKAGIKESSVSNGRKAFFVTCRDGLKHYGFMVPFRTARRRDEAAVNELFEKRFA